MFSRVEWFYWFPNSRFYSIFHFKWLYNSFWETLFLNSNGYILVEVCLRLRRKQTSYRQVFCSGRLSYLKTYAAWWHLSWTDVKPGILALLLHLSLFSFWRYYAMHFTHFVIVPKFLVFLCFAFFFFSLDILFCEIFTDVLSIFLCSTLSNLLIITV